MALHSELPELPGWEEAAELVVPAVEVEAALRTQQAAAAVVVAVWVQQHTAQEAVESAEAEAEQSVVLAFEAVAVPMVEVAAAAAMLH